MTDHITTPRALLEQVLEELLPISHNSTDDPRGQADKAINAIRAELAKPTAKGSNSCAVGILTEFTRQCADPGAICLLAQLLGVGPCPDCGYIKSHCKCVKPSAVETITTPAWHDAPEVAALKAERDAALKDAERCRWLTEYLVSDDESYDDQIVAARTVEEITCVIDAAIAKAEGAP